MSVYDVVIGPQILAHEITLGAGALSGVAAICGLASKGIMWLGKKLVNYSNNEAAQNPHLKSISKVAGYALMGVAGTTGGAAALVLAASVTVMCSVALGPYGIVAGVIPFGTVVGAALGLALAASMVHSLYQTAKG